MDLNRRILLGAAAIGAAGLGGRVRAQPAGLKIGVLTDMGGPYREAAGPLAVLSVRQALEEAGVGGGGVPVEVIAGDHQNKAELAASIARDWYGHDGVDLIVDGVNSACGLAIAAVAQEKNKIHINSGAATSELTGSHCNPNTIHWSFDTYMLAQSTGRAMVRAGGLTWFFITADYTFGHTLEQETTDFVGAAGGRVLGSLRYPFPGTTDFSAQLMQAQTSGAQVIGLASAGHDLSNQVQQAHAAGVTQTGAKLAGLLTFISDVHAIALDIAQGLVVTNSFYWDGNDRSRAFAARLKPKAPSVRPGMVHAGDYAGVNHYMKVVKAMGMNEAKKDGAATVARMKAMPTDDDAFGAGAIRADGLALHPSFLWQVKSPAESQYPWDYLKPIASTPADQAFRPLTAGGCAMVPA